MALRTEAARMLSSRSRRLKLLRSNASARKTPAWNAIQNQMLVGTARRVSWGIASRNAKGVTLCVFRSPSAA